GIGPPIACLPTLADAIARRPRAAVVANPSSLHAGTATALVEAGIPVLVEKPVTTTAAACAALAETAERQSVPVAVVQQMRFHPLLAALRRSLDDGLVGRVGAVVGVQGEHLADWQPGTDHRQSYAARPELGGGVLLTQNHLLDLMVHLCGAPQEVSALLDHPKVLGLDVEEAVAAIGVLPTGALWSLRADYHARPRRFVLDVEGSHGRARLDHYASTLTVTDGAGEVVRAESTPFDRVLLFRAVLEDFLAAVDGGAAPRCPLADALEVLAVIEAIRRSAVDGRRCAPAPTPPPSPASPGAGHVLP
ncbi:MAG TPA: Gfo/Idh/MocA family oxidoreductase, partial [Iamia sp.]|nr:Gfo/Idh/MocA family oxidoreductase [Iamia sp.]